MKTRNKALLLALCAVLLVVSTVFGTLAYLTDTEAAVNTFTVGNVSIFLDEAKVNPDGTKVENADRVQENEYHLLPGHTYTKDPTVHVDAGSEDCYVRMYVTITNSAEWDKICSQYEKSEGVNYGAADLFTGISTAWTDKGNTKDLASDNTRTYEFRYNNKVAKSAAQTDLPALFSGIKMLDEMTNDDLVTLEGFKIYVVAQAVQADGFNDVDDAFANIPPITGTALTPNATSTPIPGTPAPETPDAP